MRALICFTLALGSPAAPLAAQDSTTRRAPGRFCLRARPKPDCGAFALTNAGGYVMFGSNGSRSSARGVVDYGFMVNTSARDAFGGSVFASLDGDAFAAGPALRYRRWLTAAASLEVAVGTPLAGPDRMHGAVFGVVKWSPNHWFSLAARPEIRRASVCGPTTCGYQSRGRLSLGTEVGAAPGLVITGVAGAGFVAFLVILLTSGFGD